MSLLGGYGDYRLADENAQKLEQLGYDIFGEAKELGKEAAGMATFEPFSVVSGTGATTSIGDTGSVTIGLSPEEKALQNSLLLGAQGLFTQAQVDPAIAQQELYNQIRAIQAPEEERKRLALEERMLSQGRMGLSSDAYGGANPELLALAQAEQEAMLKANLGARTQAFSELNQLGTMGSNMLTGAYTPQTQNIALLGAGTNVAQLADLGRREGAGQLGTVGQKGLETMSPLLEEAATMGMQADESAWETLKALLGL
jgi:hypothetical protein